MRESVDIPLPDGGRLSADLWLPGAGPAPALVVCLPYRKDDVAGATYAYANAWLAERGYASVLVDLRGHGGSSGVRALPDAGEGADAAHVVEWVAQQPWCDGAVGVWGMSYAGVAALRAAAQRPPALRASAALLSPLDLGRDFLYPGGCHACFGPAAWATYMLAMELAPPSLRDAAGTWQANWDTRLAQVRPPLSEWYEHAADVAFWDAQAIDAADIATPVFLVGGWRDLFLEGLLGAHEQVVAPKRLILGPWLHTFPHLSATEPIEILPELLSWWDRSLRDDRRESEPPAVGYYLQGARRWVRAPEWPPAGLDTVTLFLTGDGRLSEYERWGGDELRYRGDPTVGTLSGLWWDVTGVPTGTPLEQSSDDAASLSFTGAPLDRPLTIVGGATVVLQLDVAEGDVCDVVVKLCDVDARGRSMLIASACRRLTAVEGCERELVLTLAPTAYEVAGGHRLRLSIACADFPRLWPTAANPSLRLIAGASEPPRVELPVAAAFGDRFAVAAARPQPSWSPLLVEAKPDWRIERDPLADSVTVRVGMRTVLETPNRGGTVTLERSASASVERERPCEASFDGATRIALAVDGVASDVAVTTRSSATAVSTNARVEHGGETLLERTWGRG